MNRWEYKTVTVNCTGFFDRNLDAEFFDELLNSLGEGGWELVTIVPVIVNGTTDFIAATLKRPVHH